MDPFLTYNSSFPDPEKVCEKMTNVNTNFIDLNVNYTSRKLT